MGAEFKEILETLRRPLVYVSKNNFAALDKVSDFEQSVRQICTRVLNSNLPEKTQIKIKEIRESFSGFANFSSAEKKKRINSALRTINKIKNAEKPPLQKKDLPKPAFAEKKYSFSDDHPCSVPVSAVAGATANIAGFLEKRYIYTVSDLIFCRPRKYDDRRNIKCISKVTEGESCTLRGQVTSVGEIRNRKRNFFQVTISDGTGRVLLTWFNYNARYLWGVFKKGLYFIVHGKISVAPRSYAIQIIHPLPQDIEVIDDDQGTGSSLQFGRVVPVYPLTEGLTQKKLRELVWNALDVWGYSFANLIPAAMEKKHGLMPLCDALAQVHFPDDGSPLVDFDDASSILNSTPHRTVIFFEFFLLQLGLISRKRNVEGSRGISFKRECVYAEKLIRSLPFNLSGAQERAISEIAADMTSTRPMNRLLQGDVGSGKTLVALISMLRAVESGYQAAIMVPTEILAEQHFRNLNRMVSPLGIKTDLLKSGLPSRKKKSVYDNIKTGQSGIIVGTHALISEGVEFKSLGLVIIDEQHRFGVLQRAMLVQKGETPDVLVMTATPIPRTLAITVYGDLDISLIDELPASRKRVRTLVLGDTKKHRNWLYQEVCKELTKGRQAYFVYPFIEESENEDFSGVRDVTRMVEELRESFSEFVVSYLHGKMGSEQRDSIMKDFVSGRCDILASTTVIEVGVDVSNATVMVIESAERFGLSQLHQMRGRVGRGEHESVCYIVYSPRAGEESAERLGIMGETSDGFRISEHDLASRGPGEFMGTKQSGSAGFSFANPIRDAELLEAARESAQEFIQVKDTLTGHSKLLTHVKTKWEGMLSLDISS